MEAKTHFCLWWRCGVTSWNDLTDKPFGEAVESTILFEVSNPEPTIDDWNHVQLLNYNVENCVEVVYGETYHVVTDTFEGDIVATSQIRVPLANDIDLSIESRPDFSFYKITFGSDTEAFPTYIKVESVKKTVTPLDEKFMPILTSPSGKKFKLSVDDSGAVTATEV